MSDISMRTITLNSSDGTPVRSFTNTSLTNATPSSQNTAAGTGAKFNISVVNYRYVAVLNTSTTSPTDYLSGDYVVYNGNSFASPSSNGVNNVRITATSANFATFTVSGVPYGYYGQIRFDIPTVKNLVYADWVNNTFANNYFCQINEFVNGGITSGGMPYWRYIPTNLQNTVIDRFSIEELSPRTHNTLTVNLYTNNEAIANDQYRWMLEVVLYSKE